MQNSINVLVAEDEPLLLRGLVSMIKQSNPNFRVIDAVSDGLEAIKVLQNNKVDILITDILMPNLDGIDLVRYIHDHQMDVLTVIVSCHSEFKYAQEALRYGVKDYILKPITLHQIGKVLTNVAASLTPNNSENTEINLKHAISSKSIQLLNEYPCYLLALLCIGNVSLYSTKFPYESATRIVSLPTIFDKLINVGEKAWCAPGSSNAEQYILFAAQSEERVLKLSSDFFEEVKIAINLDKDPLPVYMSVSSIINSANNFSNTVDELHSQIRRHMILGQSMLITADSTFPNGSIQNVLNKCYIYEERMLKSLTSQNFKQFQIVLREEIEYWQRLQCPASTILNLVKFQYLRMYNTSTGEIEQLSVPIQNWDMRFDHAMLFSYSAEQLYNNLLPIFEELFEDKALQQDTDSVIRKIDSYICTNYMEHISNKSLAKMFGFVPSYISKLFRQYKGVSPCEYLNIIRIEEAKRLIESDMNIRINDVSEAVGFSDSRYFSKVFRQIAGMLPTEYRDLKNLSKTRSTASCPDS